MASENPLRNVFDITSYYVIIFKNNTNDKSNSIKLFKCLRMVASLVLSLMLLSANETRRTDPCGWFMITVRFPRRGNLRFNYHLYHKVVFKVYF